MPNTLVHIVVNGFLTRNLLGRANLLFIYIGATLPDIPWILQRIISFVLPEINAYDLRLYSIVTSSLAFSLVLALSISFLTSTPKRTFFILMLGAVLHLLLDALETKWGNGVIFFAPVTWKSINFGLFWPENWMIYSLTGAGFIYLVLNWNESITNRQIYFSRNRKLISLSLILIAAYFVLPLTLMENAETANNHYIKTLRETDGRTGNYFEVDRGNLIDQDSNDYFITNFDEELKVSNLNLHSVEKMSIKAKFLSNSEIEIIEYHIHDNRDIYSYLGLSLLTILTIAAILKKA